jgi:hypothetical protein
MYRPMPDGRFIDYVPNAQHWEKKLKRATLLPKREEPARRPKTRMPMGRDYVSGERAAEIDERRKALETRLRVQLTSAATEKHRKVQLEARKALKDNRQLSAEERSCYEALASADVTDLVLEEAEEIERSVAARLAEGVVDVPVKAG